MHLTVGETREALARLARRGDLELFGSGIAYPDPVPGAVSAMMNRSAELRRTTQNSLDEMERMLSALPQLLGDWAVGQSTGDPAPMRMRHGPNASEDLWYETARQHPGILSVVFPTMRRFLAITDEERMGRFDRALGAKQAVRVIVPTTATDDPGALALIARYQGVGVEVRTLDRPPSWFWVDGDQLAVPYEWGENSPTSVLGIRNAALAALAEGYFDALWHRSVELDGPQRLWLPLLRLMKNGVTLDSASRTLGINPRTGRRRVSAAMDHYGVSTLFALGMAWAADADHR